VQVTKSIFTVSTIAFALVFGGGIYLLSQINNLAKPLTERIASDVLGVSVTIGEMDIRLKERRVYVRNIDIANPDGFSNPHAIEIDTVTVALAAIAQDSVDIEDVSVDGTDIYMEVKPSGTNLSVLQNNLKRSKGDGPVESTIKVIIKRFKLDGATLHPSVTLLSNKTLDPVKLSPVVLTNIGSGDNGVLARDAMAQIMGPILRDAAQKAADSGFYKGLSADKLKEIGIGEFDQIKSQVTQEIDKLKGLFESPDE